MHNASLIVYERVWKYREGHSHHQGDARLRDTSSATWKIDNTEMELATTKDVFPSTAAKDVVVILRKLKNSDIVKAAAAVEGASPGGHPRVQGQAHRRQRQVPARELRAAGRTLSLARPTDEHRQALVPRHTIMPKSESGRVVEGLMIKSKLRL
jgi:DNA-directed RNA polymerase subunit H (RpoH/RPB5)